MRSKEVVGWIIVTLREAAWAPIVVFLFIWLRVRCSSSYTFQRWIFPPTLWAAWRSRIFSARHQKFAKAGREIFPFRSRSFSLLPARERPRFSGNFTRTLLIYFFRTHMVRGLEDTVVDLFVGLLGALAVSLLYMRRS